MHLLWADHYPTMIGHIYMINFMSIKQYIHIHFQPTISLFFQIVDKSNHHAFTAYVGSSNSDWTGRTLVFPTVLYSVGTGYNRGTGIFTAPTAGTYVFYISFQSAQHKDISFQIMLNQQSMVRAMAYYKGGSSVDIHQTGTNMAIYHLQTGDTVWVKRYAGTGYYSDYFGLTTFSGFKLY